MCLTISSHEIYLYYHLFLYSYYHFTNKHYGENIASAYFVLNMNGAFRLVPLSLDAYLVFIVYYCRLDSHAVMHRTHTVPYSACGSVNLIVFL